MKNQWYCGVDGQQYGPFTWEQLRAMAAEGRIVTDSFVRRDVDQQWFQAAQIPGLLPKAHSAKRHSDSTSSIGKANGRTSDSGALAAVGGDPSKSATALQRPKKAASHSSGNIPVGAVPVGQPVATPPAGIPIGQPVAAAPAPQFAFAASPTPAAATASESPEPAKKGNNTLLIVGILGGACALVALIGIGAVVWSLTRAAKAVNEQIADADADAELLESLEGLANDLQSNPQALSADLQPIAEEMQKALQENVGN